MHQDFIVAMDEGRGLLHPAGHLVLLIHVFCLGRESVEVLEEGLFQHHLDLDIGILEVIDSLLLLTVHGLEVDPLESLVFPGYLQVGQVQPSLALEAVEVAAVESLGLVLLDLGHFVGSPLHLS